MSRYEVVTVVHRCFRCTGITHVKDFKTVVKVFLCVKDRFVKVCMTVSSSLDLKHLRY